MAAGENAEGEGARLERTYAGYARSPWRRRGWSAQNRGNVAIRGELSARVRSILGDRLDAGDVLDVGCGGGWLLAELAVAGVDPARLHGVDLIADRVAAARRRIQGADLRRADARRLPFEDGRFAAVTLLTVLSSTEDRRAAESVLREADRVLAADGVLVVYEPRVRNPLNRRTRLVGLDEIERAVGGASAREARLTVLPALARRLGPLADRLYPRLARIQPLLTHRLIVVEKG